MSASASRRTSKLGTSDATPHRASRTPAEDHRTLSRRVVVRKPARPRCPAADSTRTCSVVGHSLTNNTMSAPFAVPMQALS
jgi:hypothetical protein